MNESLKQLKDMLTGLTTEELEQIRQWCKALLVQRRASAAEEPPLEQVLLPDIMELWEADRMSTTLYLALKKKEVGTLSDLCRYTEVDVLSFRDLTTESRRELVALMDQFSLPFRKE